MLTLFAVDQRRRSGVQIVGERFVVELDLSPLVAVRTGEREDAHVREAWPHGLECSISAAPLALFFRGKSDAKA